MMRRRLLLTAAVAALMLAGPLSAHSGPYQIQVNRGTAALVGVFSSNTVQGVELADGSRGFVFLFEREFSDARGNFIWPSPDPKVDANPPKQFIGCIGIFGSSNFDIGCDVLSPTYIETDPAFNETSVAFHVQSARPDGFRLLATLVLQGQGDPRPAESHAATVTPNPPGAPEVAFAQGSLQLSRNAIVRGSIRSDLIGGGAIRPSTTPNSQMWRGLFGFEQTSQGGLIVRPGVSARIVTDNMVCFPEPPLPVGCYPY